MIALWWSISRAAPVLQVVPTVGAVIDVGPEVGEGQAAFTGGFSGAVPVRVAFGGPVGIRVAPQVQGAAGQTLLRWQTGVAGDAVWVRDEDHASFTTIGFLPVGPSVRLPLAAVDLSFSASLGPAYVVTLEEVEGLPSVFGATEDRVATRQLALGTELVGQVATPGKVGFAFECGWQHLGVGERAFPEGEDQATRARYAWNPVRFALGVRVGPGPAGEGRSRLLSSRSSRRRGP